ncbi:hypothetical protein [Caballeronia sp.]|uniref:hypothetical protein n=1 Tax=Caballeronia sp. TaxID=1931223 RepID=UPI003C59A4C5
MPDSAVNPASRSAALSGDADSAQLPASSEAEGKPARTARSPQRLALLNRPPSFGIPYGAPTLDLFADDAERATLQAMNTDVRQGTLAGFELPEVFMAAVSATAEADDPLASVRLLRPVPSATASQDLSDERGNAAAEAASLELAFDDVPPPDGVVAGPVPPEAGSEIAEAAAPNEALPRRSRRMSEARAKNAVSTVAAPDRHAPESLAATLLDDDPGTSPLRSPVAPKLLTATLIDDDRRTRPPAGRSDGSTFDTAQAAAFADITKAMSGLVADHKNSAAALSRRMKTLLAIVVCVLLASVATGIAQAIALKRLTEENTVQQLRIEQLMQNQAASLESFFDTDSANVGVPHHDGAAAGANDLDAAQPAHSPSPKRSHITRRMKRL